MVEAVRPVDSDKRFAALPVGQHNTTDNLFFINTVVINFIIVVLPVPGPPVKIKSFEFNASNIALYCSLDNVIEINFSTSFITTSGL